MVKGFNAANLNVFSLLEDIFICDPPLTDSMFMACRDLGQTWAKLFITNHGKKGDWPIWVV